MKRVRGVVSLTSLAVAILLTFGTAPWASATIYSLADKNSTAVFDSASSGGFSNWVVNGSDVLNTQWFWYRVGSSGPESSLNSLAFVNGGASDANFDGTNDTLFLRYTNSVSKFVIEVTFSLSGGAIGSKTSDIAENIKLKNVGTSSLDFHFFQYTDLDLGITPSDIVTFLSAATVKQTNTSNGAYFTGVATPGGSHHEASLFPTIFTSLTNSTATTLSDANGPITGNATWAFQWDTNIVAGASVVLLEDNLTVNIPEPSSFLLSVAGLCLLGLSLRRTHGYLTARSFTKRP